jgi:high-affinity Fe2+/Pb2+ permease
MTRPAPFGQADLTDDAEPCTVAGVLVTLVAALVLGWMFYAILENNGDWRAFLLVVVILAVVFAGFF